MMKLKTLLALTGALLFGMSTAVAGITGTGPLEPVYENGEFDIGHVSADLDPSAYQPGAEPELHINIWYPAWKQGFEGLPPAFLETDAYLNTVPNAEGGKCDDVYFGFPVPDTQFMCTAYPAIMNPANCLPAGAPDGCPRLLDTTIDYYSYYLDGDIREGAGVKPGRHPLVILGTGAGGDVVSLFTIATRLASHGYVVVTKESSFIRAGYYGEFDGDTNAAAYRGGNTVKALISYMHERAQTVGDLFHGRVHLNKVAAGGHSFGAVEAFHAASGSVSGDVTPDDRIDGVISLDSFDWDLFGGSSTLGSFTKPVMFGYELGGQVSFRAQQTLGVLATPPEDLFVFAFTDPQTAATGENGHASFGVDYCHQLFSMDFGLPSPQNLYMPDAALRQAGILLGFFNAACFEDLPTYEASPRGQNRRDMIGYSVDFLRRLF